jgi:hypothetical protein
MQQKKLRGDAYFSDTQIAKLDGSKPLSFSLLKNPYPPIYPSPHAPSRYQFDSGKSGQQEP